MHSSIEARGSRWPLPLVFAIAVLAIAIFSCMDAVMKGLVLAMGAYTALLWRNLAGVAVSGLLYAWRRPPRPTPAALRLHAIRGFISTIMAVAFFWGLARMVEQAEGVDTGPVSTEAPASQDHVRERLAHILWKIGTDLPPMAVVGLDNPQEAISGAVERAGADAINVSTYPVVAVALYALSAADRVTIAARLPVLP